MKRWPAVSVSVLFLLLAATGGLGAEGPQLLVELDKALEEVKTWEHGGGPAPSPAWPTSKAPRAPTCC